MSLIIWMGLYHRSYCLR